MKTEKFGEFLRKLRLERGISMKNLAPLVGVKYPYLSMLEKGLRMPSPKLIGRLAKFFDIGVAELASCCDKYPPNFFTISEQEKRILATYYREYPDLLVKNLPLEEVLKIVLKRREANVVAELPKREISVSLEAKEINKRAWNEIYQKIEKKYPRRKIKGVTVRFIRDKQKKLKATIEKIEFFKLKDFTSPNRYISTQKKPIHKSQRSRTSANRTKSKTKSKDEDSGDDSDSLLTDKIFKSRHI